MWNDLFRFQISEKKNDRVEPVERSASPNLEAHDSEATDILPEGRLTETSEIASRIRLFKSRTIQMKSRPISVSYLVHLHLFVIQLHFDICKIYLYWIVVQ